MEIADSRGKEIDYKKYIINLLVCRQMLKLGNNRFEIFVLLYFKYV